LRRQRGGKSVRWKRSEGFGCLGAEVGGTGRKRKSERASFVVAGKLLKVRLLSSDQQELAGSERPKLHKTTKEVQQKQMR
jgi:hypothetical protein